MILVLSIAACIALHIGTEMWSNGEQRLIDRSDRRDLSLFQLGLRGIVRFLLLEQFSFETIVLRLDTTVTQTRISTSLNLPIKALG